MSVLLKPSSSRRPIRWSCFLNSPLVSVARKHDVDPEAALRRTLDTFSARTGKVESFLRERAVDPRTLSASELDRVWKEAKEALQRERV